MTSCNRNRSSAEPFGSLNESKIPSHRMSPLYPAEAARSIVAFVAATDLRI